MPDTVILGTARTPAGRLGTTVEVDEAPRRDTLLERLASLRGLGSTEGSHPARNSPGVDRRRGGGYGCAAICSGGGQGDAVIITV
jgi:acetyl-CoA C-acetyltransferase